jgi:hypothetical protein
MTEIKRWEVDFHGDEFTEHPNGEWVRWDNVKDLIASAHVLKSFHVFIGDDYYPGCGLQDYRGSYETLAQALEHARTMKYIKFAIEIDAAYACVLESTREGLKIRLAKGHGYGGFFGDEGPPDGCLVEDLK